MYKFNSKTGRWENEDETKNTPLYSFNNQTGKWENPQLEAQEAEKKRKQYELQQKEEKKNSSFIGKIGNYVTGLVDKGAFDDGYQAGDVTKTLLSTGITGMTEFTKGILNIGEGIGDLITYGEASLIEKTGVGSNLFDPETLRSEAKKKLVDGFFKKSEDFWKKNSITTDSSDALINSLGYMYGTAAIGGVTGGAASAAGAGVKGAKLAANIGTYSSIFTSAMGNNMTEAYENGATNKEAYLYGLIGGSGEVISEMMFGGIGYGSNILGFSASATGIEEQLARKLTKNIQSTLFKNIIQGGVLAASEGVEEVVAGLISAVGKKLTYMKEEDINKLIQDENLLESFLSGAISAGLSQGGNVIKSTKAGQELTTGYTKTDQKIIDNEVNERVKEKEQDSKVKLTNKQKAEIRQQVIDDFENGEIDVNKIRKSYDSKAYDEFEKNKKEITRLEELPNQEITVKEMEKLKDLRVKNKELINKLDTDILENNKSGFIQGNYDNYYRSGEKYTYEKSDKMSKSEKALRKSAITAGANNTNQTHKLVDSMVNLNNRGNVDGKQVLQYRFTNNQLMEDAGIVKDGKTINGYKKGNTVYVNIDSQDAIQHILGHETTHFLEGIDGYDSLKEDMVKWAKEANIFDDIDARIKSAYDITDLNDAKQKELYESELTSEIAGNIFEDTKYIERLSQKPTLFNKVKNIIDDLVVQFKGTAEEKRLRKIQKEYQKVFDTMVKEGKIDRKGNTQFSQVDNNKQLRYNTIQEAIEADPKKAPYAKRNTSVEFFNLKYNDMKAVIAQGSNYAQIAKNSGMDNGVYNVIIDNQYYEAYFDLLNQENGNNEFGITDFMPIAEGVELDYDNTTKTNSFIEAPIRRTEGYNYRDSESLKNRETTTDNVEIPIRKSEQQRTNENRQAFEESTRNSKELDNSSFFDNKTQYSLTLSESKTKTDNNGNKLSKDQKEYFKNSKITDENGNLITVYHTTTDSTKQFNEFNPVGTYGYKFGDQTVNFYTNSKEMSGSYAQYGYEQANTKKITNMNDVNELLGDRYELKEENGKYKLYDKQKEKIVDAYNDVLKLFPSDTQQMIKDTETLSYPETLDYLEKNNIEKDVYDVAKERCTKLIKRYLEGQLKVDYFTSTDALIEKTIRDYYENNGFKEFREFNNQDDLFRNITEATSSYKSRQYSGYLNITNPYVVDGNEKYWNGIIVGSTDIKETFKNKWDSRRNEKLFNSNIKDLRQDLNALGFDLREDNYGDLGVFDGMTSDNELATYLETVDDVWNAIEPDLNNENDIKVTTNDIIKNVINQNKQGANYDGVIIRNIYDYGSATGGDAADVYVSFNSNQFKAKDNLNPTTDSDIRYSLSPNGEMVDQDGNKVKIETTESPNGTLMVLHNLGENKFNGILDLGGIPVPSLAITKPSIIDHNQFGEGTLIFDKETINPANRLNEVYDRDIWSPTYPQIDYNIKSEDLWNLEKNIYNDYKDDIVSTGLNRFFDADNLDSKIKTMGIEGTIEDAKQSPELMYIYEKTVNPNYQPVIKTKQFNNKYSNELLQNFIDNYDGDTPLNELRIDENVREQFKNAVKPYYDNEMQKFLEKLTPEQREAGQKLMQETYNNDMEKNQNISEFLMSAYRLQQEGIDSQTIDKYATLNQIKEDVNHAEFEKWIDDGLGNMLRNAEKGIYNGKDYITDTGRRTFKQLHNPYNLENLVKVLTKGNTKGSQQTIANGFGKIQAQMGNQFESISDIKSAESQLTTSEDAHNRIASLEEAINQDIYDLADRLDGGYFNMDNASNLIQEYASKKNRNENTFRKLASEYANNGISSELIERITNDLEQLKTIPTDYFEAKPQRAVGLNEIEMAVIPNSWSQETKQRLQDLGIKYTEYDPSIEGDRNRVINQFDDLKFSLSRNDEIAPVRKSGLTYGEDIRLQNTTEDIAPVRERFDTQPLMNEDLDWVERQYEEETQATLDENNIPVRKTAEPLEQRDYDEIFGKQEYSEIQERDWDDLSKRSVKAYQYEHPEVKEYFQPAARDMLGDLQNSIKGERFTYGEVTQDGNFGGTSRLTTNDIEFLLDNEGYTYSDIEKGLKAIIENHGSENIAVSKKIEMLLDERLRNGYTDVYGNQIPANQDYIQFQNQRLAAQDIEATEAPIKAPREQNEMYETIRKSKDVDIAPIKTRSTDDYITIKESPDLKERKWTKTATESEGVKDYIKPEDIDIAGRVYEVRTNQKTLDKANAKLDVMGYDKAVDYFKGQFMNDKVSAEDIALGQRLIQESIKKGDYKQASDLIQDVSILGTELGQKVQALSLIQRMTPEGQLKMLEKTIERGKIKEVKAFKDIELNQDQKNRILDVYNQDGTYDQETLNKTVEDIKQELAAQMPSTIGEKTRAWRYLSMLGNPKTHLRNIISNIAMQGTVKVKNAMARTIEDIAPIQNKTKTWKRSSDYVKQFAKDTTMEMKDIIRGENKYSEQADILSKRKTFKKLGVLNWLSDTNSNLLEAEDWWFSKSAFNNAFEEYLTANGIETEQDILENPEIVEKGKLYAVDQAQIATFRQYSWLASKINEIENKNAASQVLVGAVIPFKKTPINIAKTALNYSPVGWAKTLTYDINQVRKGNMEASTLIDHISQNATGTALTLVGYMLAQAGFLKGAGDDDKEGKYDSQLGQQSYSIEIGGNSYSLSWLSPVAMPLFVGVNAYEQLEEGKEWNGNVVTQTLAETLDPLSEMSFLSSLDQVLSSYDSGVARFAGMGESAIQSYVGQYIPTASSQLAATLDDTKRSTKVTKSSGWKFFDETVNQLKYKIPGLRETLEPSVDIWGNEVKQSENIAERAYRNFLSPYAKKELTSTPVDEEIKRLYAETGDTSVIPTATSTDYINYGNERYNMSAKDFTNYKKEVGSTSYEMLEELFNSQTYKNSTAADKADLIEKVYKYSKENAKKDYLENSKGITYTNSVKDGTPYYKENSIKGAIKNDVSLDEYSYYQKNPDKYVAITAVDSYDNYEKYSAEISNIKDMYSTAKGYSSAQRKAAVREYIQTLNIEPAQKLMLEKLAGGYSIKDYKNYIVSYLDSTNLSQEDKRTIYNQLFK